MKFYFLVLGLALGAGLIPEGAFAQGLFQGDSGSSSSSATPAAPDTLPIMGNPNPFTDAAGADRYIQDNTTGGFSVPNAPGAASDSNSLNNFIGGNATDDNGDSGGQ